jgi:hypothetical protein
MFFIKWINTKVAKMNWLDFALTKLSVFLFTLFLITCWSNFLVFIMGIEWWWFLILSLLVALPVLRKMFS